MRFIDGVTRAFARAGSSITLSAAVLIPAAGLQEDAAILRSAFETLHPGLLRYNTPAQIDEAFGALGAEFERDRTLSEAYLAFSKLAATVKCGHTYANFFNQGEPVREALLERPRIPFAFRWIDRRMIVTRPLSANCRLSRGTEVLTIDDVPVGTILERLMTVARADGHNDAKRVASLQVEVTSRYETFDVFWPLFFPSERRDVTLTIREPRSTATKQVVVPLMTFAERAAVFASDTAKVARRSAGSAGGAEYWDFSMLERRVGLLRMRSWAVYNTKWNWQADIERIMKELVARRATDLVIDLRGNEGGSDVGDVLVSHFVTTPVPRQVGARRVRYREVPAHLVRYLDTWDPSFRNWGPAALEHDDRFFRLRRDADDDPGGTIAPAAPHFAGRVWVLVGPTNSSATFEFAQTVRQNGLGTLVGQTTGGNQRGINGGAFFFLRLPHSGIEVDVPLIGQFPDGERPDAGLDPDIPVVPSVEDVARGRDTEMYAVRAAIRSSARAR